MTKSTLAIFLGLALWVSSSLRLNAQQQSLFSHYFWNEQHYNPAYAGSKEMIHTQAIYRMQWVGFEGAPRTFNATVHSPLKNTKLALGFNVYNDQIGAYKSTGFSFQYAYRLPLTDKIKLSMGLQGGMEFGNLNFGDLITDDGIADPASTNWNPKSITPIVGTGIYLYGEQFSFGFGIPQLLNGKMLKGENLTLIPENHFFLSGAYQWNYSENLRFLPTTTIRITKGAPVQAEFNASAILYDMFQAGLGVRTDKTVILMGQVFSELGEKKWPVRFGYSYDIAAKPIRTVSNGSHEFMLSFGIRTKQSETSIPTITSPRYF